MGNSVWGMSICKYVVQLLVFVKTKLLETYPRFQENSNLAVLMNSAAVASASVRPSVRPSSHFPNNATASRPSRRRLRTPPRCNRRGSERASERPRRPQKSPTRPLGFALRLTAAGGEQGEEKRKEKKKKGSVGRKSVGLYFFPSSWNPRAKLRISGKSPLKKVHHYGGRGIGISLLA